MLHGIDAPSAQAAAWYYHGLAHQHLHRHSGSITCHKRALDLYRQVNERHKADTLVQHPQAERLRRILAARPDQVTLPITQVSDSCCQG